jgi:hypothetical protein
MPAPRINEKSDGYYDRFKLPPGQDAMAPIVNWLEAQKTTPEPFDFWPTESKMTSEEYLGRIFF